MHASAEPALAVGPPPRRGGRYRGADRLPHVPRHRNHHFANGAALEHAQEMAARCRLLGVSSVDAFPSRDHAVLGVR